MGPRYTHRAEVGGRIGPGGVEGVLVTSERPVS
jgi:hypothetical protein